MVNSTEQSCRSNQDAFHTYILADCAAPRNNIAGSKHEAIPISTWPGRRLPRVIISDQLLDAWSACTDTSRRCNESNASAYLAYWKCSSRKVVILSQVSPYVTSSINITNNPKPTPPAQQHPEQARRDLVSRPPGPSSHPPVLSPRQLDPAHHLDPADQ